MKNVYPPHARLTLLSRGGGRHAAGKVFFILMIAALFSACKKDEEYNDIGYGYFPTQIGHWVIYEVDSTIYDDFANDTIEYRYQVKEVLESEFTDNQGRPAIRVERYKRMYNPNVPYDSIPWYLSRVWSFTRTNSAGEKMEENQRFIRLAFPVEENKSWDGNVYNQIGSWNYKYKEVDQPYSIAAHAFDSTLLVQQKLDTNRISYKWYAERYAKNVGMIEKRVYDVSDTALAPTSVLSRIHSGFIYSITLVDYGN